LRTFPSIERSTDTYGLQFEFVPEGVYEGTGLNVGEARRVAEAVVAFARPMIASEATRLAVEDPEPGTEVESGVVGLWYDDLAADGKCAGWDRSAVLLYFRLLLGRLEARGEIDWAFDVAR
jgi:hypothetical protein